MIRYRPIDECFRYLLNQCKFSFLLFFYILPIFSFHCVRNVNARRKLLHLSLLIFCSLLPSVCAENVRDSNLTSHRGNSTSARVPSTLRPAVYSVSSPLHDQQCWKGCRVARIEPKANIIGAPEFAGANEEVKVVCRPKNNVTLVQLCLSQFPSDTRILEIHNTSITSLGQSSFSYFPNLRKLDLSYNDVSRVAPNAFAELSNLRRLDLSHNKITELKIGHLKGLQQLIRLKLNDNPLRKIDFGVLEDAPSLNVIELSNTQLHCDCNLKWLVESDENTEGKQLWIRGTPVCQSPEKLIGKKVKKLKPDRFICDPTELVVTNSVVELEPGIDQVVFAGDSLRLHCRVGDSGSVAWKWGETVIREEMIHGANHSLKVNVKTVQNNGNVESLIEIPEVSWGHSGEWTCVVDGKRKKNSKSISIYVIHRQTQYCPLNVTINNKGTYTWPRAVAKVKVSLPCQAMSHYSSWAYNNTEGKHATHYCNDNGKWIGLDTSKCSYILKTTRVLEHFTKTDLISAKTNVHESSRALRNFTANGHVFKDPMDIVFLTRTIVQYVKLLTVSSESQQTARTLMEIIASTLSAEKSILEAAQNTDGSCASLVKSLWELGKFLPYFSIVSRPHFSFNQISFKPEAFGEVSCVWFRKRLYSSDRSFQCGVNNSSLFYTIAEDITDARIRIPASMFLNQTDKADNASEIPSITLQFIAFDSANLYSPRKPNWQVTSPVLAVRMTSGVNHGNDSVYITLRSTLYSHEVVPAHWTNGSWSQEGCKVIRVMNSMVFFRCNGLSDYGLLQDVTNLLGGIGAKGATFKASPIAIYVGSALCNVLLMSSIATWCIHHQRINTQGKNKHSYVNTWIALLFLNSLFTVGIYQTESVIMCKIVGLFLHYLTTCVLLWITVSVTNLYKKISKNFRPPVPSEEPPLPPKPMFRFYLVGWGIALILCGISTAVNLDHYSTYHYCFMAWSPSLAAFYAPCVILIIILVAFFLLTHCLLRSGHEGYSETNGNTETTELELLDTVSPSSENPPSIRADDELSVFSQKSILSVTDSQHSPMTQLKAHIVTLLLFILTWTAAAITTASPFSAVIPHHELIFSLIYAVCATSLGVFIFMFFCACRSDITESWKELSFSCLRSEEKQSTTVANNIFNTFPNSSQIQTNNQLVVSSNVVAKAPSVRSVSSSHTVTNKSSSVVRSVSHKEDSQGKMSNAVKLLNLSVMSDGVQYPPESFYNPKQSGVARRFFQKQRLKQMMKQNNLEMSRDDSDYNSSAVYKFKSKRVANSESDVSNFHASCLGASSKINNTNIHVDCVYSGSKHSSKSPTPELLCVFGPPKENCNIVSSTENNQHLWPVANHQQCSPRLYKMTNKLQTNFPDELSFSGEDSVLLSDGQPRMRYQPMAYNKMMYPVSISNESKDDNTVGTDDGTDGKLNFIKRHKKVVHRPDRPKRKRKILTDRQEIQEPLSNLMDNDSLASVGKRSNDEDLAVSFSPLSFSSLPFPTSCLGTPSSISPLSRHADGFSPDCNHVDWMHLLKKRVIQNEDYHSVTDDGGDPANDDFCDYDQEQWAANAVSYRDIDYRMNTNSDVDTISIATSLIPAVDTSPPGSLAVSDSPFDSPLHKLHQNTPDRISMDSESHLSPLPVQFSARDSPSGPVVTPTGDDLSLTDSTDLATPNQNDVMGSSERMYGFGMFSNYTAKEWPIMRTDRLPNYERDKVQYEGQPIKKSSSFTMSSSPGTSKIKQSSSLDMDRRFYQSYN